MNAIVPFLKCHKIQKSIKKDYQKRKIIIKVRAQGISNEIILCIMLCIKLQMEYVAQQNANLKNLWQ